MIILEDGDSFIYGKCKSCSWHAVIEFTIGDEEREVACSNLEKNHKESGCTHPTALLEKGITKLCSD